MHPKRGKATPYLTPGSKWFLLAVGNEGLNSLLAAYLDKSAKAVCTFGYAAGPGQEPVLFQGVTEVSAHPDRTVCGRASF